MDDLQLGMQIIQPHQHLPRQNSHGRKGDAPVPERLDEAQQVVPQDLEDHTDVGAIRTGVLKPIQEADAVALSSGVPFCNLRQELDLVASGLRVVRRGLLDFEGSCDEREEERMRDSEG